MSDLDTRLLAAHQGADPLTLSGLYHEAGQTSQGTPRAFYLTHALVYALEAGSQTAKMIEDELRQLGCI
ncbi:hypothetical protein [Pseudooceanicola sp. MF1-13]|uniref:hypothetical protein n=1 Tax=Pseudooceanicola sp. MF1-13 TaxID=3379095 RepID=UPI003891D1D7